MSIYSVNILSVCNATKGFANYGCCHPCYLNKGLHVKFGSSRAVLKLGKITGMKLKISQTAMTLLFTEVPYC